MLGRLHLRIPSHQPDYPKSPSLPAVKVLIWLAVGVPMNATCSSFQLSLVCTTHLTDRWQTKLGWKKEINEGLCMLSIHCSIPSILSPIPPPSRAQSFLGISYHHRQTTVKWSHKVCCQVICQINRLYRLYAWHLSHWPFQKKKLTIYTLTWFSTLPTYIMDPDNPHTYPPGYPPIDPQYLQHIENLFQSHVAWRRLLRVSLMQKGLDGWNNNRKVLHKRQSFKLVYN